MITLTFLHNHDCEHKGEEVKVHPRTNAGAYYNETLICVETKQELLLVGEGKHV